MKKIRKLVVGEISIVNRLEYLRSTRAVLSLEAASGLVKVNFKCISIIIINMLLTCMQIEDIFI